MVETPRAVKVTHCTWLQFGAPPASQALLPTGISVDQFFKAQNDLLFLSSVT